MSSLVVVALVGPKGSGKTTIAKILESVSPVSFVPLAFADTSKDALDRIGGSGRSLHKELDAAGVPIRRAWQMFGSESRHDIGNELLWADVVLASIRYLNHYHPAPRSHFVIHDMRFPHEDARVREQVEAWGGRYESWSVNRPGIGDDGAIDTHESEQHWKQIRPDRVITNDCSRVDLATRVLEFPW